MYLFLSVCDPGYSRTGVYYSCLSRTEVDIQFITIKHGQILRKLREIRKKYKSEPLSVIIASPSQILSLPVFLIFRQRPTLDAGWSLFEASITSRKRAGIFYQKALKNYFIDFVASLVSRKIVLESKLQLDWYRKIFFTSRKKLHVVYTGVDELGIQDSYSGKQMKYQNRDKFKVVFRGKDNLEAGLQTLAECTYILENENIDFHIFSPGIQTKYDFAENTSVYNNYIDSIGELISLIEEADLILGQLSAHPRTKRTIPHKAFEAAYLPRPYLTARSPGVLEIFEEDVEVACCNPDSATDLARAILEIKNSEAIRSRLTKGIHEKYQGNLTQSKLSNDFLKIIRNP